MLNAGDELRSYTHSYKITGKLGSGSYGTVFSAADKQNRRYAIKIANHGGDAQLQNENRIYERLKHNSDHTFALGVPQVYDYFYHQSYPTLIIELLGSSLRSKVYEQGGELSLKSCLMAGAQLVSRLQHVHELGYLHRDLKPDNILTGRKGHHYRRLYIVDFGLGRLYREFCGRHYEFENEEFAGTILYAGVNVLSGMRPSRRDDLEALGYSLVELLRGKLPWGQIAKFKDVDDYINIILEWKKRTSPQELGLGFPGMEPYMAYVRSLRFEDRPRYSFLRNCFEAGLSSIGEQDDGAFDWYSKKGRE